MSGKIIEPRTLKGFRDYLPESMIPRERLIDTAKQVYRSYGFSPIDTPALEYEEVLTGKSASDDGESAAGEESERQMFRFVHGKRRVGMRFDLTVPLARFVAKHVNELGTPFKRYHIATVWRGESPQRGRYREFMQCDFDTIGTKSIAADIETGLVIYDLMKAIGFDEFTIHINNRQVLNGLLAKLDLGEKSVAVLRSLDKLAKIGRDKVIEELKSTAGATPEQANEILKISDLSGTNDDILSQLQPIVAGNETGEEGLAKLAEVNAAISAAGVQPERFQVDVSIARGLDYYTGTVFETFLDALPNIGSVCSGGRYDNLAELYTKQELPGIGASLGLDRLLTAMEELKMIETVRTPAHVFIPYFDKNRLHEYLRLANQVRSAGYGVEVFPNPKNLGSQLKYADRRGFSIALIAGEDEFAANTCQVKDLQTKTSQEASLDNDAAGVVAVIRQLLSS